MAQNLQGDLRSLVTTGQGVTLPAAQAPAPIPAKTGLAAGGAAGGSGISSPLVEQDYTKRDWHPEFYLATTDGVFTIQAKRLKTLKMEDSAKRVVVLKFADKPAP